MVAVKAAEAAVVVAVAAVAVEVEEVVTKPGDMAAAECHRKKVAKFRGVVVIAG